MVRLRERFTGPSALVALAMVMWLVTEIVVVLAFGDDVPIPQIVWLRYGFHLALMCLFLGIPSRFSFIRTHRPWLQLGRSLMMLVMPLSVALAIRETEWDNVAPLFWTAPLFVLIMASFAGERTSGRSWIAVSLAVLGVLAMNGPSLDAMSQVALPSLAAAASFAGYIVLTRVLDRTEPLLTNMFHSALGVFIALSIPLATFWVPLSARQIVGALMVAVCGWITLWLLELGLRRDSPGRLAPVLFLQALLEWAARANRDSFTDIRHLGPALVVLAAVSAAFWLAPREQRAPETVV